MARKEPHKAIHIPGDLHQEISQLADELEFSTTRMAVLLLRKVVAEVKSEGGVTMNVRRSVAGDPTSEPVIELL